MVSGRRLERFSPTCIAKYITRNTLLGLDAFSHRNLTYRFDDQSITDDSLDIRLIRFTRSCTPYAPSNQIIPVYREFKIFVCTSRASDAFRAISSIVNYCITHDKI